MLAWVGTDQPMKMRETSRGVDKKLHVNNNAKTELVKALAEAQFDDEENIVRIDCSELMEAHTVSKLIGSPAGLIA